MADNIPVDPTASYTVAADVIGVVGYQRVKLNIGIDGVASSDVGATTPLPVSGTVQVSTGTVSVSGQVQVSGAVSISVMPAVSISVSAALGTVITILGTQVVTVVQASATPVWITGTVVAGAGTTVISGTVTAIPADRTTALPSVSATGGVVWIANTGAQITTASPGATATGVVIWIANPTTFTAVVTVSVSISPTVNISGVTPVTTQTSVSVAGHPVWWAPGALVGISVSQALGTVITVLGTQIVSVVPGVSVNALVTGVVSVSVLPAVSISVSAVLGTVITVLGTVLVSIRVSQVLGTLITVVDLPYVSTGAMAASSTGLIVLSKLFTRIPFQIVISSTVVGASTTLLMTVYTGNTIATTGASFFVAASRMRVQNIQVAAVSSAVLQGAALALIYGTAAASLSVTATVGIGPQLPYLPAATSQFGIAGFELDGPPAATTVGVGLIQGTSHTIQYAVISGYLF